MSLDCRLDLLLGAIRHESSILVTTLIGGGRGVLELPSRNLALVEFVQLPISTTISLHQVSECLTSQNDLTYLRVVEPKENGKRHKESCPDVDGFDT